MLYTPGLLCSLAIIFPRRSAIPRSKQPLGLAGHRDAQANGALALEANYGFINLLARDIRKPQCEVAVSRVQQPAQVGRTRRASFTNTERGTGGATAEGE